jgi:hypothetical protein
MPNPGALRFNTDSQKLELYDGNQWTEIVASSPDSQTGGARGLFGGGYAVGISFYNTIDYITISTTGNALDFGDLIGGENYQSSRGATSSSTRGLWGGGSQEPSVNTNSIDYVTISSTGDAQDFGDLTVARRSCTAVSNTTRGVWAGGRTPVSQNVVDYITIASTGNAQDFGDISRSSSISMGQAQSSTRGLFAGGYTPSINNIDFITTSTLGNSADFGDLNQSPGQTGGCSNAIRALFTGDTTIDYVTIATLGNAADFGDLPQDQSFPSNCSSSTRGVFAEGQVPSTTNSISYVQIMSTGNVIDFGDLTVARLMRSASFSNGHGGL